MPRPAARTQRNAPDPSSVVADKGEQIVRAAREVFLKHGFSAASTDMIQTAAGVSKATMYARFATKEALFIAVVEASCADFLQAVRRLELPATDLRSALTALAHAYLQIVLSADALSLFRVVIAEAPRFPELARRFYLAGPAVVNDIVAAYLQQAAERGEVDFSEVGRDTAAALFVSLVRSEAHLLCLTHPKSIPSDAQTDQWASLAVTTFLRAYGTGRAARKKPAR
jgi:TetR/AcrR family transcriptional regulator, mexJK operon transcriptional repressor